MRLLHVDNILFTFTVGANEEHFGIVAQRTAFDTYNVVDCDSLADILLKARTVYIECVSSSRN